MHSIGLIFGPNGAGKGTLANGLCDKLFPHYIHLNSGKLIRDWARFNGNFDLINKIDRGEFVSNEIVHKAWDSEFMKYKNKNLIIEGFPRKYSQNYIFQNLIVKYKYNVTWIINLYLPEIEIIKRLKNRLQDLETGNPYHIEYNPPPQDLKVKRRKDDTAPIVKKRFEYFIRKTIETLSYSKFLDVPIITIDARKSIDEVLSISYNFIKKVS